MRIREGFLKKAAVLLDFVQMRGGGGHCPNFLAPFHKFGVCVFGVQKKFYPLSKLGGGGEEVIWTKSKRTTAFFREPYPYHDDGNGNLNEKFCASGWRTTRTCKKRIVSTRKTKHKKWVKSNKISVKHL